MSKHMSKATLFVVAIVALVAASVYFVASEFSPLSGGSALATSLLQGAAHDMRVGGSQSAVSVNNSAAPRGEDDARSDGDENLPRRKESSHRQITDRELASPLPSGSKAVAAAVVDSADHLKQDGGRSESDEDLARLEQNKQPQMAEGDVALPPPSGHNIMAEAIGEYADQVNLPRVVHKATSADHLPPEVVPGSHPPSGNNVASASQGDEAREVDQQALIEKAKSEGYPIP